MPNEEKTCVQSMFAESVMRRLHLACAPLCEYVQHIKVIDRDLLARLLLLLLQRANHATDRWSLYQLGIGNGTVSISNTVRGSYGAGMLDVSVECIFGLCIECSFRSSAVLTVAMISHRLV